MSYNGLQNMVGRAVISAAFCADLLGPRRAACLADCDLTPEEIAVVCAIPARDLTELAVALEQWLNTQTSTTEACDHHL